MLKLTSRVKANLKKSLKVKKRWIDNKGKEHIFFALVKLAYVAQG